LPLVALNTGTEKVGTGWAKKADVHMDYDQVPMAIEGKTAIEG
jgi:hypothetical protein